MRPYLAIIKDSFREALASRVLWILLGLISVTLLGIAPLTYREEATVGMHDGDIKQWPLLIEQLRAAKESDDPTPARRVWQQLDERGQKIVNNFKGMPEKPTFQDIGEMRR